MVTEDQKKQLIMAACEARKKAYAPYSDYAVGAAILAADGQIFTGVNVENASFGLSICAERSAVFSAVTAGVRRIVAVAVCTQNAVSPCGACRQVLSEFGGDPRRRQKREQYSSGRLMFPARIGRWKRYSKACREHRRIQIVHWCKRRHRTRLPALCRFQQRPMSQLPERPTRHD